MKPLKLLLVLFAVCSVLFLIVRSVPTIKDQRASQQIYEDILREAGSKGLALHNTNFHFSPKRNSTRLIASGQFSESDKQTLNLLVDGIRGRKPDHQIKLEFR